MSTDPVKESTHQEPSEELNAKASPSDQAAEETSADSAEFEAVSSADQENDDVIEEQDPLAQLQSQVQELQQNLLRKQADFDNFRKRMRREMEEAGNRALIRFVRPMLSELDNFGLAIDAANPEQFNDFALGVTMIKQNIDNHLSGSGIAAIPCEGIFDPAKHEVLSEVPNDDLPRGSIMEVFRQGYQLNDQIIRAAQVVVSKPSETVDTTAQNEINESEASE